MLNVNGNNLKYVTLLLRVLYTGFEEKAVEAFGAEMFHALGHSNYVVKENKCYHI